MSASVCCPGCQVTTVVPTELLGRTGRCNKCARRIRLATPTAELLDDLEPAAPAAPPVAELLPTNPPKAVPRRPAPEDDEPDEPVLLDEPDSPPSQREQSKRQDRTERTKRAGKATATAQRGPSKVLLAAFALLALVGGGVGGVFLIRALTAPEPRNDTQVAEQPQPDPQPQPPGPKLPDPRLPDPKLPDPKLPDPKIPDPKLPGPKLPDPKLPDPKLPDPKLPDPKIPDPPKVPPAPKQVLKLPGAVASFTPSAGGRYIVFQMVDGMLVLFDAKVGKTFWTLNGAKPDDLIAVSREKLFIGKPKDARIDRFDLATAASEGSATLEGAAPGTTLKFLATGASSDGPILMITQRAENSFGMRLIDAHSFANLSVPIDEGAIAGARAFPFSVTTIPTRVSMSADGRAILLGNRYLTRTDAGYRGGLLSGAGIVFAGADGQAYFGAGIYGPDALRVPAPAPPAGSLRRYLPAVGGPLAISVEYKNADLSTMKFSLHLGADPNPLGPLPGGEVVGAWARGDGAWSSRLHQRLIFLPELGLLVFVPPGSDTAQIWPIDIAAMLKASGRPPVFTSVAPAETRTGRAYSYRATAVAARGPLSFALDAGPPGMQMTREGQLTWTANALQPAHDIRVSVTDGDGRKTVQSFRLLVAKEDAVVAKPKPPDPVDPPVAVAPGASRAIKLPSPATEVAAGGNGRFVVLNLPAARQVAVFDAKEGKVVKYLDVAADAVVAVGREHLFLVNNETKSLERWSLATFEKEATDKLPAGGPFSHAHIGSNSIGPLMLCAKGGRLEPTAFTLIDTDTLKPLPVTGPANVPPAVASQMKAMPLTVRVSPDGQTFTWSPTRAARGAVVARVADGKAQWKDYQTIGNPLVPDAGGRYFYTYEGVYDDQLRRVYPAPDKPARVGVFAPAAQGNLFLEAEPAPPIPNGLIALQRANLFLAGQSTPFATIAGLDKPVEAVPRFVHLAPRYGMLVMLSRAGSELALHPFDFDAALTKSPTDYLVVLPEAPERPVAGGWFGFVPVVKSKKGGVKMKLDAGPEGMKATPAGGLAWNVPAGAAGKEFVVSFTVSDASGQEVRQTFRLTVVPAGAAPPPPEVPAAPGLPVAPPPTEKLPLAPPPRAVEKR